MRTSPQQVYRVSVTSQCFACRCVWFVWPKSCNTAVCEVSRQAPTFFLEICNSCKQLSVVTEKPPRICVCVRADGGVSSYREIWTFAKLLNFSTSNPKCCLPGGWQVAREFIERLSLSRWVLWLLSWFSLSECLALASLSLRSHWRSSR